MSTRPFFVGVDADSADDWDNVHLFANVIKVKVTRTKCAGGKCLVQVVAVTRHGDVALYRGVSEEDAQAVQHAFLAAWAGQDDPGVWCPTHDGGI